MSNEVFEQPSSSSQQHSTRSPSEETVFEVLSNGRRRFVFRYLKQEGQRVGLRELAEHVAAWENDKPVEGLSAAELKRVKTALHQHHMPKMDASGFVEYDAASETVTLDDGVANLEVHLDVVPGVNIPWSRYYLGVSVLGLVALACAWVDAGPFALVSGLPVASVLAVVVLVSALVQTYLDRTRSRLGGTG